MCLNKMPTHQCILCELDCIDPFFVCVCVCVLACLSVCACMCVYTCLCVCACMFSVCACVCMCVCICVCVCVRLCSYMFPVASKYERVGLVENRLTHHGFYLHPSCTI